MTNLLKISLAILLFCGCHSLTKDPNLSPENACETPVFAKKLVKTMSQRFYPGTPFNLPDTLYTNYFFDIQNRLDSINDDGNGTKIIYLPNGQVEKTVHYSKYNSTNYNINLYTYNSINQIVSILYSSSNPASTYQYTYKYQYDSGGFLLKKWLEGGNDVTHLVRDSCGNFLKVKDIYNTTGVEHFLSEASFETSFNPLYLIGFNNIFPNSASINNVKTDQIVHWDCAADYDGGLMTSTYEYNSVGLPTRQVLSTYYIIDYFYE
jgi:hypothetical protein